MANDQNNKWTRLDNPPPKLFTGQPERNFVKQVVDEIAERILGQTVLYYPIDIKNTDFDSLYGEAIVKSFHNPVKVDAFVLWSGIDTVFAGAQGLDRDSYIVVKFHKRRLDEDQDLFIRAGDFILWGGIYYEITDISLPRELWGDGNQKFEIAASCKVAREGVFDAS